MQGEPSREIGPGRDRESTGRARFWLGLAIVLAAAGWLLSAPIRVVREGQLLVDTDPHYHVLRAERIAAGAEGAPWRDPQLAFPDGADILWPPGFDLAIVAAGKLAGARTRAELALAAAWLPVVLALLALVVVALVGRAVFGRAAGVLAAGAAAAMPAIAWFSMGGRIDHHVAEILFTTAIALAYLRGLQGARGAGLALGLCSVAAFWTWMGSAVALAAPAVALAWAWLAGRRELARRGARTLAEGAGIAAALLAATIGLFGRPGALTRPDVHGVNLLHVCVLAGLAAFAAIAMARSARRAPLARRGIELAAAAALPALVLFAAVPGLAAAAVMNLMALRAANPWYADIQEFRPAFFSGYLTLASEARIVLLMFGLVPALAAYTWVQAPRGCAADPEGEAAFSFLRVWGLVTLALALTRTRFFPYFAVPCAIAAGAGAWAVASAAAARLGREWSAPGIAAAMLAVATLPALPVLERIRAGADHVPDAWVEAARWLRSAPSAPDGRRTVGAPWELGHLVQYEADRPVIASPFGSDGGARALPEWAAFLFATDERTAEEILLRHGVSDLLLRNPVHEMVGLRGFAPDGPAPVEARRDVWRGETVAVTPALWESFAARLYFADGAGAPPAERIRLLYETASTGPDHPLHEERVKVFGFVPGADVRIHGAAQGERVRLSFLVRTGTGRTFEWTATAMADATGDARFRVPYASGANGESTAGGCEVEAGARHAVLEVPARAVQGGERVEALLHFASRPATAHPRVEPRLGRELVVRQIRVP